MATESIESMKVQKSRGGDVKSEMFDESGAWHPKGGEQYVHSSVAEDPDLVPAEAWEVDDELLSAMRSAAQSAENIGRTATRREVWNEEFSRIAELITGDDSDKGDHPGENA